MSLAFEQWVRLPAWRAYAACHGQGTLFYSGDRMSQRIAVTVCSGCGVLAACRAEVLAEEAGLAADERFGVRGGLLPGERVRLARSGEQWWSTVDDCGERLHGGREFR